MSFVFHLPYSIANEKELVLIPSELCRNNKIFKAYSNAVQALIKCCEAAAKQNIFIVVISSYRNFEYQKNLFVDAERRHGRGKGILWVAPPGYSEHHTGYVFDLADKDCPQFDDEPGFENTAAGKWLAENAMHFGFRLSFPKNNWQHISYEPWHWKFVGDAHSKKIFDPLFVLKYLRWLKSVLNGIKMRGFLSLR